MLLKSQTKQVYVLKPWNLSLSKRLHISTITKLQRLSCKQAETLKQEGRLKRAFPQWEERAHTHWRVASCQSGINKPRARLSTGPCCCPTICSGIKAAAYARLAWDCRKTCKPLQRATANIDYLEHLEQTAQWTYFRALTNRLDFPSDLGCSEAGRRESLTVPLIKCAVFRFKNHHCRVGARNGQMTVLSFARSIIFTLEVKSTLILADKYIHLNRE